MTTPASCFIQVFDCNALQKTNVPAGLLLQKENGVLRSQWPLDVLAGANNLLHELLHCISDEFNAFAATLQCGVQCLCR